MTAEKEYLVNKLIEAFIELNNPGLGDDALVEAYQDIDLQEEAREEIREYLN